MWKNFCRHVEDVEKKYIEKDGIVEDTLDEMVITIGDHEEESDDEDDDVCTDSRQELDSDFLSSFDTIFLQNVLPLTD